MVSSEQKKAIYIMVVDDVDVPVAPVTTAHFPNFFKSLAGRKKVLKMWFTALNSKLTAARPTRPTQAVSRVVGRESMVYYKFMRCKSRIENAVVVWRAR